MHRGPRWLLLLAPLASGLLLRSSPEDEEPPKYRVAVVTSGLLVRYFLENTATNLIAPLVQEGHTVDYFLSLNAQNNYAWIAYARHFVHEPAIAERKDKLASVASLIKSTVKKAGGKVRGLDLLDGLSLESMNVPAAPEFVINASGWNAGAGNFTLAARESVVKMLWQQQQLWKRLRKAERSQGPYDIIITTRDDSLWLTPFSLNKLLVADTTKMSFLEDPFAPLFIDGLPGPVQGYHMRCMELAGSSYDAQRERGVTEYVFVLRRQVAEPFFTLFDRLMSNKDWWAMHNLEMYTSLVAATENVHMAAVPAALLPMQRAGRLQLADGNITTCIHKACDSATASMALLRPMDNYPLCQAKFFQTSFWHLPELFQS